MKKISLSTTKIIMLGFFLAIFVGTALLLLPFATSAGKSTDIVTALFTATTSVCVTGLVAADTFSYWSTFGHIVILCLIQVGGLGIVTLTTGIMLLLGKKITLKNRLLLEDYFNLDKLGGLSSFLKKAVKGTLIIEVVGAVIFCFKFVPDFGIRGVWIAVFQSVSAFCNAGIDIIGSYSLSGYSESPIVLLTTAFLIISGGLGFVLWWDVIDVFKKKPSFSRLKLHSKIVLITTALLLFGTTAVILLFEYNNPETLAGMPFFEKLLAAFFQSATLRTAGFFAISQKGLRDATALFSIMIMFIGGSPIGTAGGIKTTTLAVIIIAAKSYAKGGVAPTAFGRTIPKETVMKALTVILISFAFLALAVISLSLTQNAGLLDITFEAASAIATVGLTRSLTASLDSFGKILIIICMYLGRIGPISLVLAMIEKRKALTTLPEEDVRVG